MKKYFLISLGITSGIILSLAILAGGVYWWIEVRVAEPPNVSIELEGFPDAIENERGERQPVVRILITNNEDTKLSFNDAYLYLTRVDDGARTNFGYQVNNITIYPKEKYIEIVPVLSAKPEWIKFRGVDEFETEENYLGYREKWISQIKNKFKFNFTFVSDSKNIRILLDVQKEINEIEDGKIKIE